MQDTFPVSDKFIWVLVALGAIMFIPFIGGVHLFDWDEINFAEISREMIRTNNYLSVQVNYEPFYEKPPLFAWLQVVAMKIFGVNEFAARLPNAIGGILTLVLLYKVGERWVNKSFGALWSLAYLASVLPVLYHKSGIMDPWFNLFIFSSIASWLIASDKKENKFKWFFLSGVLGGLATLTKGPVGPLIVGMFVLTCYAVTRNNQYLKWKGVGIYILGLLTIAAGWFTLNWFLNGPEFTLAFINYQIELLTQSVAGHKGFPGYHVVVTLLGMFPASIFALGAISKQKAAESDHLFGLRKSKIALTVLIIILFSIVQSKIVHYSSMTYYPVSFLAAWWLHQNWNAVKSSGWIKTIGLTLLVLIGCVLWLFPYAGMHIDRLPDYVQVDQFTLGAITEPVKWELDDFIPALWFTVLTFAVIILWARNKRSVAVYVGSIGMAVWVNLALIFFVKKIEHYTQRASVEFCESLKGQNVEIIPFRYKSYLPYFYADKPVKKAGDKWNVYYITRIENRDKLDELPPVEELYQKGGFIFLKQIAN